MSQLFTLRLCSEGLERYCSIAAGGLWVVHFKCRPVRDVRVFRYSAFLILLALQLESCQSWTDDRVEGDCN